MIVPASVIRSGETRTLTATFCTGAMTQFQYSMKNLGRKTEPPFSSMRCVRGTP